MVIHIIKTFIAAHATMTPTHNNLILMHDKMIHDHQKITADHVKFIPDYGKIIADRSKMTDNHNKNIHEPSIAVAWKLRLIIPSATSFLNQFFTKIFMSYEKSID
jgi:hypothetical protein